MRTLEDLIKDLEREGYIRSQRVKEAMLKIDRKNFVPERLKSYAYEDEPLEIGENQTISAPHMVAMMLELLEIESGMKILEIGSGSGYNACLLEYLAYPGTVVTIERKHSLSKFARENLKNCPYKENIKILVGDGSLGYEGDAPYDRIVVTCGAPEIPRPLLEQLKINGIMIIPLGGTYFQDLYKIIKKESGIEKRNYGSVAFVPLIGEYGFHGYEKIN